MGRIIRPEYHHYNTHPLLSLSLFVLSFATTVAIFTALCGFLNRKKEKPDVEVRVENDNNEKNEYQETLTSPPTNNEVQDETLPSPDASEAVQNDDVLQQPLPPPPAMRAVSCHYRSCSQASSVSSNRKLASSMSMSVQGLASRQASKREDGSEKKRERKLKHEDSIWTKTIILGEKCKVPDEDEDDGIVYDEKGNRVTPYHPKTSTALSLSRQSSDIDEDVLPR